MNPGEQTPKRCIFGFLVCCLFLGASCQDARRSAAGFRLPEDGDVDRGRAAFVELRCHTCHTVAGEDLPQPTAQSPVALGGSVEHLKTDGYLVTSIIHPSHALSRGIAEEQVTVEGESRMPDYSKSTTVRQLVDMVAFLQSKYKQALLPLLHP